MSNVSIYLNNPWKPIRHSVLKSDIIADELHETGYTVLPFLSTEQLEALNTLYSQTHNITDKEGGMFYSVYSQDLVYRKKIHQEIQHILQLSFERFFQDYRVVMNSFVIKAKGPKSEFYVHQDSTGLDENKYSTLSLWIPLHDINANNGAMCVMNKSHKLFSPYRGISVRAPYDRIHNAIKKYLHPVFMKAGEAMFFDHRIVHNSLANLSDANRVVVTCGIFPKEAQMISCFQASPDTEIEIIAQNDDFLMEYPKFLNGCYDRPNVGNSIGFVKNRYPEITEYELDEICKANDILPLNSEVNKTMRDCNMISEPVSTTAPSADEATQNLSKGFFAKLKQFLAA